LYVDKQTENVWLNGRNIVSEHTMHHLLLVDTDDFKIPVQVMSWCVPITAGYLPVL